LVVLLWLIALVFGYGCSQQGETGENTEYNGDNKAYNFPLLALDATGVRLRLSSVYFKRGF